MVCFVTQKSNSSTELAPHYPAKSEHEDFSPHPSRCALILKITDLSLLSELALFSLKANATIPSLQKIMPTHWCTATSNEHKNYSKTIIYSKMTNDSLPGEHPFDQNLTAEERILSLLPQNMPKISTPTPSQHLRYRPAYLLQIPENREINFSDGQTITGVILTIQPTLIIA